MSNNRAEPFLYIPSDLTSPDQVASILKSRYGGGLTPNEAVPLTQDNMEAFVGDGSLSLEDGTLFGMVVPRKYIDMEQAMVNDMSTGRTLQVMRVAEHIMMCSRLRDYLRPVTVRLTMLRQSGSQSVNDEDSTLGYVVGLAVSSTLAEELRVHKNRYTRCLSVLTDAELDAVIALDNPQAAQDDGDGDDAASEANGQRGGQKKAKKARSSAPVYTRYTWIDVKAEWHRCVTLAISFLNVVGGSRVQKPVTHMEVYGRAPRSSATGLAGQAASRLDPDIEAVIDPLFCPYTCLAGDSAFGSVCMPVDMAMEAYLTQVSDHVDQSHVHTCYDFSVIKSALAHVLDAGYADRLLSKLVLKDWARRLVPMGSQRFPTHDVFFYGTMAGEYHTAIVSLFPNNSCGLRLSTLRNNAASISKRLLDRCHNPAIVRLLNGESLVVEETQLATAMDVGDDVEIDTTPNTSNSGDEQTTIVKPAVALANSSTHYSILLLQSMAQGESIPDDFVTPEIDYGDTLTKAEQDDCHARIVMEGVTMRNAMSSTKLLCYHALPLRPVNASADVDLTSRLKLYHDQYKGRVLSATGLQAFAEYVLAMSDCGVAAPNLRRLGSDIESTWESLQEIMAKATDEDVEVYEQAAATWDFRAWTELYAHIGYWRCESQTGRFRGHAPVFMVIHVLAGVSRFTGKTQLHILKTGDAGAGKGCLDDVLRLGSHIGNRSFTAGGMRNIHKMEFGITSIPEIEKEVTVDASDPKAHSKMSDSDKRNITLVAMDGKDANRTADPTRDGTLNVSAEQERSKRHALIMTFNWSGNICDPAFQSRVTSIFLTYDTKSWCWDKQYRQMDDPAIADRAFHEHHLVQHCVSMACSMQHYDVLRFEGVEHAYLSDLLAQAVDTTMSAIYGQSQYTRNNRVMGNLSKLALLMAWTHAITRAVRMIMACQLVDITNSSVYRVVYMAVASAKANVSMYLPGAAMAALHEMRDSVFGSPTFEVVLGIAKMPGHEHSFYGEELMPTVPCKEDMTFFADDAKALAVHPVAEYTAGFKIQETFMPSYIASVRSFGVRRRRSADMGGERDNALHVPRSAVAHCHPFLTRAVLAIILRQTVQFTEGDKSKADVLTSTYDQQLRCLQTVDFGVLDELPCRMIVRSDPDGQVTGVLAKVLSDPLLAGQAGSEDKLVALYRDDLKEVMKVAMEHSATSTVEVYRQYSASPSRLFFLLTSKTTREQFEREHPDESQALALDGTVFDKLMQSSGYIQLNELFDRATLCNKSAWDLARLEKVLTDLKLDTREYIVKEDCAFGGESKHRVLRVDSSLMNAVLKASEGQRVMSAIARENVTHLLGTVLATVRFDFYPFSPASQAVLDMLIKAESPSPTKNSCLLRCNGNRVLRPALIHPVALEAKAQRLLTELPDIQIRLATIASECRALLGAKHISRRHVANAIQGFRDFSLAYFVDGTLIPSAKDCGLDFAHDKIYVSIKPSCMPALYASFGGDLPAMLYSRQITLDCGIDHLVSMVTLTTRNPLDWSQPFMYMSPSRTEIGSHRLLVETYSCRHRHNIISPLDTRLADVPVFGDDISILQQGSVKFADIEPVLARQRTTGANGSHMYVGVGETRGITQEILERLERLQAISVQARTVGPSYKESLLHGNPGALSPVPEKRHTRIIEDIFGAVSESEDEDDAIDNLPSLDAQSGLVVNLSTMLPGGQKTLFQSATGKVDVVP